MNMMRCALASAVLALAAVACGGSDRAEEPDTTPEVSAADGTAGTTAAGEPGATTDTAGGEEPSPPTGTVGEAIPMGDCCEMTVHAVTDPYPTDQLNPLFQPGPDERALGVDVEFVVHDGEPRRLVLSDLSVRDDAGAFYTMDTIVGGGQLENVVQAGTPLRSTLIFTVDNAATGLRLELAPLTAPEPLVSVHLA
jgi:hypothetical protein